MKNKIISILFPLFFLGINISSFGMDRQRDKIIRKYFKAIGGIENWNKIKTIRILKHSNYSTDNLFLWSNTEIVRDKGMQIESYINQGMPTIRGINNKEGWKIINGYEGINSKEEILRYSGQKNQISILPDSIYQELKFISSMPWQLFDIKKNKISYKGTCEINDETFEKLDIKIKGVKPISCFFSTKYSYLEKVIIGHTMITFSDFRMVQDIFFPFKESRRFIVDNSLLSHNDINISSSIDFITDKIILNSKVNNENMEKPLN
jgi:hypothetical protein